ncbi:MAG: hypothetical protein LBM77_09755 [Spirochaetaceae bacterium]|jgi:hypothetical protein|nr:hypothetical protein [Spirochaetaceae bacterium]
MVNYSITSTDDPVAKRDTLMQQGFRCLERNENEKAAEYFTDALEIRPSGNVYAALAFCAKRAREQNLELNLLKEAHKLYLDELDIDGIHYCEDVIKELEDKQQKQKELAGKLIDSGIGLLKNLFLK